MNSSKNLMLWVILAFSFWMILASMGQRASMQATPQIAYSQFLTEVENRIVKRVEIEDQTVRGERFDGTMFTTVDPKDPGLIGDLVEHGVEIAAIPPAKPSFLAQLLAGLLPILLVVGFLFLLMRRSLKGGPGGVMGFGRSKAREFKEGDIKTTLKDVAGVEEAKEEVAELVDFLRDPKRFASVGGSIPRGVLMVGPPGTGKTLLARAIAGEAKVPFFSMSGSDFVEMFVGVGASRVRDLFENAKKSAPCIVFIDEIDAVGRKRGAGLGGGHDEREQTLNQMLVEMDGFQGNEGVIVVAATNRPDVLDPALLRPGRFDRQVMVGLPDVIGREQILKIHMRKVAASDDVEPRVIARGTPGFSGADLANLVNEAALLTARARLTQVSMDMFEKAKDKILMGAERNSMVMTEDEKRLTAYHESGHTIVGRVVPEHDPVHKVSIVPRGRALGVTVFLPERDRYSASKRHLESQIASLFGGRVAEEIIFGEDAITTGAENDIQRATDIARKMVTRWGLTPEMGPVSYAEDENEVFLGRSVTQHKHMSDDTARRLDEEVRNIIDRNYERARTILREKAEVLHAMAEALMEYETLDKEQIDDLMAGRPVRPAVKDRDGSGPRVKVDIGSEGKNATRGSGLGASIPAN
jgi:cell division protease FtsH